MSRFFNRNRSEEDQEIELRPIQVYSAPPIVTPPESGCRNPLFELGRLSETPELVTPPILVNFISTESHLGRDCARFWMLFAVFLFFLGIAAVIFVAFWSPESLPGHIARRVPTF